MIAACTTPHPTATSTPDVAMQARIVAAMIRSKDEQIAALQHQIEWFRRQIFGAKSERFIAESNPEQMYLGQMPVPRRSQRSARASPPTADGSHEQGRR